MWLGLEGCVPIDILKLLVVWLQQWRVAPIAILLLALIDYNTGELSGEFTGDSDGLAVFDDAWLLLVGQLY